MASVKRMTTDDVVIFKYKEYFHVSSLKNRIADMLALIGNKKDGKN